MNLDDMKCWEYSMAVDPNEAYVTNEPQEEVVASDTVSSYQGSCNGGCSIYPEVDMNRWESCDNSVVMANAEWYYTKEQTEELIDSISGLSPSEVQDMINRSIHDKADKAEVDEQINSLTEQIRQQSVQILQRYTKEETNNLLEQYLKKIEANHMFANYSKVENTTLILNSENIN